MRAMINTIKYRKEHRAWQKRFDAHAPKPGDAAPDFQLFDVTGKHPVRLSDFKGKQPVALILGSYT